MPTLISNSSQNGTKGSGPAAPRQPLQVPYSLEMVPVDKLFVDPKYQRGLTTLIKRMEDDFDPAMFIPLQASERKNGKLAVFDGQHRLEAARDLNYAEVPCLVYHGLSPQQEATLFSRLQRERRNITAADRFRATLYGDPSRPETEMAKEVERIAEMAGFTVGSVKKDGKVPIASPTALESIYKVTKGAMNGPEALSTALSTIALVWKDEKRSTDADLIKGMGLLYVRHADKIDEEQLVERLREVTPGIILGRAQESRTGRGGGGAAYAVYRTLVNQYNRGGGKRIQQPPAKKPAATTAAA